MIQPGGYYSPSSPGHHPRVETGLILAGKFNAVQCLLDPIQSPSSAGSNCYSDFSIKPSDDSISESGSSVNRNRGRCQLSVPGPALSLAVQIGPYYVTAHDDTAAAGVPEETVTVQPGTLSTPPAGLSDYQIRGSNEQLRTSRDAAPAEQTSLL
eukprot:222059-Hanusia_phi.AAC.1